MCKLNIDYNKLLNTKKIDKSPKVKFNIKRNSDVQDVPPIKPTGTRLSDLFERESYININKENCFLDIHGKQYPIDKKLYLIIKSVLMFEPLNEVEALVKGQYVETVLSIFSSNPKPIIISNVGSKRYIAVQKAFRAFVQMHHSFRGDVVIE